MKNLKKKVEKTSENENVVIQRLSLFSPDVKQKDKYITLKYQKKGFLFNSSKEIRLLFSNEDLIEKFLVEFKTHIEYVKGIDKSN